MQREVNTASHSSFFFSQFLSLSILRWAWWSLSRKIKKKRGTTYSEKERRNTVVFKSARFLPEDSNFFFFPPMSLPLSNYISFFFLTQTGEHISCWLFFFLLSSLPFRTPLSHGSKGIINNNKEPPHYLTTSTVSLFFSFPLINRKSSRLLISALGGKKKKEHRQEQQ